MPELILSEIHRFPVKSLRGARLECAKVGRRGLEYDRHWMLVDSDGKFLTQRQAPNMALIDTEISDQGIRLRAPGREPLSIAHGQSADAMPVTIWRDACTAVRVGDQADRWLSDYLEQSCHLVFLPFEQRRAVDPAYAREDDEVGFADGYPFLLISEASLEDLNARLEQPVTMERFRPNLVIRGCEPFAEDDWRRIRIGELEFRVAKPCSRCIIPTIDPETGTPAADRQPIRTLMNYRRWDNQVWFGQNLIHSGPGELRAGQVVEILE